MPGIAALILAAGGSTRMGLRKQLLKFQGQTLLRRVTSAAVDAALRPAVVVIGCEAERMLAELASLQGVEPVVNFEWERGIGSSIRVGMSRLIESSPDVDAVLIALVDQPRINAATFQHLTAHFRAAGKAVCASSYSKTIGPPVVVSRQFFAELLRLPDAEGAKSIWTQNPQALSLYPCEEAGDDIDTPGDFEKLKASESAAS